MILDPNIHFRNEILSILLKSRKRLTLAALLDLWPNEPVQLVSELNHMIKEGKIIGDTNKLNDPFTVVK